MQWKSTLLTVLLIATGMNSAAAGVPGWEFSNGSEFPGASGSIEGNEELLRLHYDFSGGGGYVGAYHRLDPPQAVSAVRFEIRKPATASIVLRVQDSTDQMLQKRLVFDAPGWQAVAVALDGFSEHWGGANDGAVHQPVVQVGVLVERAGLVEPSGVIETRDLQWEPAQTDAPSTLVADYLVTDFSNDDGFYAHDVPMQRWGASSGFGSIDSGAMKDGVWTIDFGNTDAATLYHSLSLHGNPRRLTLKLRGGAPGNVVSFCIGSHYQGFFKRVGVIEGPESIFTVDLPPAAGWEHKGGEGDGVPRPPLRISGIELARGTAPAATAEVQMLELRCETVTPRSQAIAGFPELVERSGTLTLECTLQNFLDAPVTGEWTVALTDWEYREIDRAMTSLTLPAGASPQKATLEFALPAELNFVEASVEFHAGALRYVGNASWTRPLGDPGDDDLQPASPWGMGLYFYRYADNPEGLVLMDRAAGMAQAAGIKWSREEFSWGRTEPAQGLFDFRFYDDVVDTARRHGISVYGLLAYWAPWTDAYTEKGIDDFCAWAKELVGHFKDRVKHWEVYNEPNIHFWTGPKELYPVLLKKAYAAIKEADPEAQVLGISTSGIDLPFIDQCLEAGAPFDVLTIHPYRISLIEAAFMKELRDVAKRVGERPVWITEMGWGTNRGPATPIGGKSEREQAKLLARAYLSAMASGACQNISWYDFRNDGKDPFFNEENMGVVRYDLSPKPAYRAAATVCRTLSPGVSRLQQHGEVLQLEMGGATALWSPVGNYRVPCRLGEGAQVQNLMGEVVVQGPEATVVLRAGQPVFIRGSFALQSAPEPVEDAPTTVLRF